MSRYLFAVVLIVFATPLLAEENGKALLAGFFKDLKSFSAEFKQSVQNSQLNSVERAEGTMWISRPGKFRWDYALPYEQQIVSNGEKIWIFDADLEQVTVKAADKTLGNTPALLLSNTAPLEETFDVYEVGNLGGLIWVELVAKDPEAGFSSIRLGFLEGKMREMLLQDNLGQTTSLIFNKLQRNIEIDSSKFNFVPPKGADIFDAS